MGRIRYFILIFGCFLFIFLSGTAEAQVSYEKLFQHQQQLNFQEKVYIHTDKDSYIAGETVWFRAHRADAALHLPHLYSGLVYVDLYSAQDSLVSRMKLTRLDSCFHSSLRLNSSMLEGDYYMVAYTNWMRNFDSTLFSKKKIHVFNTFSSKVHKSVDFRKGDEVCFADYTFRDETDKPFSGLLVKYITRSGQRIKKQGVLRGDHDGRVSVPISPKDTVTSINVEFLDEKPLAYYAMDPVPFFEEDFDLQFMPEGGHWLAGIQQRIAFKAVGENGKGEEVSGTVVDEGGQEILSFVSVHKGMGVFTLKGIAGKKYMAKVRSASGLEKTFNLPEPVLQGVTLQTMDFRGALRCAVLATPGFTFPDGLTLIVHSRGRLLSAMPVKSPVVSEIPAKILPKGLVHFALVAKGQIFCERLAFAGLDSKNVLEVSVGKPHYDRREKVNLDFILPSGCTGDVSLSVTDSKKVYSDTLKDNIESYFLLTSDIRGTVEDPAWYFDERVGLAERSSNMDLLLMTQAWKRFNLGMVCRGHTLPPKNFLELQQGIAGKILNMWGKPAVKATLAVVGVSARIFRFAETDSTGRFEVNNLSFPEGTTLVIQGTKGKSGFVDVQMEEETFPRIPYAMSSRKSLAELQEKKTEDDFLRNNNMKYYYENGVKVYILDEVNVSAVEKKRDLIDAIYEDASDFRATTEELDAGGYATIFDWLGNVPGIYIENGDEITYRGKHPKLFVDDIPRDLEEFRSISITDVASIGFIKSIEGMIAIGEAVTNADAGAVVVRLKDGVELAGAMKETANFFKINPLGYHRADTFYSPKYVTPQELKNPEVDERTTLYWNPRVVIGKDGRGKASFYTADIPTLYRVVAEGIASNGEIIRKEFLIDRR